jgi:hypothetical protein
VRLLAAQPQQPSIWYVAFKKILGDLTGNLDFNDALPSNNVVGFMATNLDGGVFLIFPTIGTIMFERGDLVTISCDPPIVPRPFIDGKPHE